MYEDVEGWPWLPSHCPCDEEFISWAKILIPPSLILHMGSGLHHRVGIDCCAMGHSVIGLTISREEVVSRPFRVDTPNYQVFYSSLDDLNLKMIPKLDVVTLFHFGEAVGDFSYQALERILSHINPGGYVVFYNRSAGWGNSQEAIQTAISLGRISLSEHYGDLDIYRC